MQIETAYQTRTSVLSSFNASAVDFAANILRAPVSFHGDVRQPLLMRQLMVAMHEVIISDLRWGRSTWQLDPVITVHPDEIFFEAFSSDTSAYVRLAAKTEAFNAQSESTFGTTNVDFTFALRNALQNLRSARKTTFAVGAGGFGVKTEGAVRRGDHYEQKVDVPDTWVKGFLQVQSALAMKPFTFRVRPVDLLNVITHFVETRARKPPHGLRFEFQPNEPIRAVLEPWNHAITLQDTTYSGYPRVVRLWGRQRLEVLMRVLPYADKVTVGVLGRGLPHFYICHCGDYTFTLVLSGWVRNDWSATGALDLLAPQTPVTDEQIASVYNALIQHLTLTRAEVEAMTTLTGEQAEAALFRLCREGRAMYDPIGRGYRSRELFAESLDFESLLAPDPRIREGQALAESGAVVVQSVAPSDTRVNETKVLADVTINGKTNHVLVAVDQESRLRFAQCDCDFFKAHIMNQGPCEHILAARFAAESQIQHQLAPADQLAKDTTND